MLRLGRRSVYLSIAASAAVACVPLPGNRQVSREIVARKEAENTLVSDRGATCRVKADTFERVNIGDEHACIWKNVDSNGAPRTTTTDPMQDQAPRRAPGRPGGA